MADNELAKYLSIYRKRKKEDEDQIGGAWPDYQGAAAGYSGGSGGGGIGGVGNAGGYVAPGGSNMLASFASGRAGPEAQMQESQGSGGGSEAEGPQPGTPGTLDDAMTGFAAVMPLGVGSLLGFVALSEKEKAQEDINLGLNTARASFGRALGMEPTKDPFSYGPDDASGFQSKPGTSEQNAGLEPSGPVQPGYNPNTGGPPGPGSSYGPAPATPGYSDIGVDPGATSGMGETGGLGPGSDPGQAGNTGGASSESPGQYAYGGMITPEALAGPDPVGPDEGLVQARSNEFVMQPEAVQYYGPEIMQALNSGEIPRMALMAMIDGDDASFTPRRAQPRNNLAALTSAPQTRNNLASFGTPARSGPVQMVQ